MALLCGMMACSQKSGPEVRAASVSPKSSDVPEGREFVGERKDDTSRVTMAAPEMLGDLWPMSGNGGGGGGGGFGLGSGAIGSQGALQETETINDDDEGHNSCSSYEFGLAGTLDPTFNPSGVQPGTVSDSIAHSTDSFANAVVIQPADGKIVVAGPVLVDGLEQFGLARFNPDGSLDTSFNPTGSQPGTAYAPPIDGNNTASNVANALALQEDGKIVVVGNTQNPVPGFGLARFNVDGTIDTTFNHSGAEPGTASQTTINGFVVGAFANGVAIDSNGNIVVVGLVVGNSSIDQFAIARFLPNGHLDVSFNSGGTTPGTASNDIDGSGEAAEAYSVVIDQEGNIVVAGTGEVSAIANFAVARYTSSGVLDSTFNALGNEPGTQATTIDNSTLGSDGFSVALQRDGKIVVGGTVSENSGQSLFGVARFDNDGAPDLSFNPGGIQPGTVSTAIDNFTADSENGVVAIQDNGKIVIAGYIRNNEAVHLFAAARFTDSGRIDTTFNAHGVEPGTVSTTVDNLMFGNNGNGVAIQSDGKIVVAGEVAIDDSGTIEIGVVRFYGDPVECPFLQ